MGAALGGDERVDLVDDDGFYRAERFARVGGEQEVEGLGCGDEDFAGVAFEAGAFAGAGVAGADADLGDVYGDAIALGHVGDALERGAEVAFDVDREGFERRDVEHATAGLGKVWRALEHEPIEAPQKRCEGFAGAGGREDEGGFATRD